MESLIGSVLIDLDSTMAELTLFWSCSYCFCFQGYAEVTLTKMMDESQLYSQVIETYITKEECSYYVHIVQIQWPIFISSLFKHKKS